MAAKELTLAIHVDAQHATWQAYERWVKKLDEMSGGRIKVNVVHSGFVGIEEWNMLKSNQCDIARIFTLNMGPFPMHAVPALPFLLPATQNILSIVNSLYDDYLYREWEGTKVLWLGVMSTYHLHTREKPVRRLEDLRGLKIQASGLAAELIEAWGGEPVETTAPEGTARQSIQVAQYNALKTGVADGIISTFEVTKDFKLHEVTRHHTYLHAIRDVNATAMSAETWNSLPTDVQKIFAELNPWAQQELADAQATEAEEGRSLLEQAGHTMIELQPEEYARWVDAVSVVIEETLARLDARQVPATAIAEEIKRLATELLE